MPDLAFFQNVCSNPAKYARKWKSETNGRIIGHFCSYTPIEIVIASRALPFRIFSNHVDSSRADGHLQSYCCNPVRSALHEALAGHLDFLDGVVFPHTCDSIQRLSDIWRINKLQRFHADIILPVKLNTDSARDYMIEVLSRFRNDLERAFDLEITDEQLRQSIEICNRNRKSLNRLYQNKQRNPNCISAGDLYSVFQAAMVADSEQFSAALERLLDELDRAEDDRVFSGKRIVLSGGLCQVPDVWRIVERHDGSVVWDDFCNGTRYFQGAVDEQGDPISSIAKRYFERIVCPAKHVAIRFRGDYLIEAVRNTEAQGVVFVLQKFCDPHAFDYPYMKEMLDKNGIPSVLVEIESQASATGQLETRIEAFIEML
jgi:bzd-type benzoyl-CoA reductase N subunit